MVHFHCRSCQATVRFVRQAKPGHYRRKTTKGQAPPESAIAATAAAAAESVSTSFVPYDVYRWKRSNGGTGESLRHQQQSVWWSRFQRYTVGDTSVGSSARARKRSTPPESGSSSKIQSRPVSSVAAPKAGKAGPISDSKSTLHLRVPLAPATPSARFRKRPRLAAAHPHPHPLHPGTAPATVPYDRPMSGGDGPGHVIDVQFLGLNEIYLDVRVQPPGRHRFACCSLCHRWLRT